MSKILVVLLILFLLPLTACKGKQITKDYPSLQDTKNIIEYVTIDEVLNNLEKLDKKIIVFGFKKCPWCQSCIRPLNDVAVELGFKSVWYLDIKNMRDNEDDVNHKKYLQLFNLIKDNIGNPEKIIAPTVIMVKNNKITGYHTGTVESHVLEDGNLPVMTKEQTDELKKIYYQLFE
ncbi:MAG: hypothetical protein MR465_03335 [Bacilli bacterium]|nr:hypothetical protein [Bacilli bacterium]